MVSKATIKKFRLSFDGDLKAGSQKSYASKSCADSPSGLRNCGLMFSSLLFISSRDFLPVVNFTKHDARCLITHQNREEI